MKYLIFLLCLLFMSCAVESIEREHYHFEAWEADNGMIRVSYYSDYFTNATLYGACNEDQLYSGEAPIHMVILDRRYSEYAFTPLCRPIYFKIVTDGGEQTIKI